MAAIAAATAPSESPNRRIIPLNSRSTTDIPITDLIVDGKLDIYPHIEEKGLLFLQFRRNMGRFVQRGVVAPQLGQHRAGSKLLAARN